MVQIVYFKKKATMQTMVMFHVKILTSLLKMVFFATLENSTQTQLGKYLSAATVDNLILQVRVAWI